MPNFKKNRINHLIIISILALLVISIGVIVTYKKEDAFINIIKRAVIGGGIISEEIKEDILNNKSNSSEAYFCKGYVEKKRGNEDEAKELFENAIIKRNINTHKFVSYYINSEKGNEYLKKGNGVWSARKYTDSALSDINFNRQNGDYKLIWEAIKDYSNYEGGRDYIIDVLEEVVKNTSNIEARYYLTKKLAPVYFLTGNSTKAIKAYLYILDKANELGDSYSKAQCLIEIGSVFNSMGAYDSAEKNILMALDVEMDSDHENEIFLYGEIELGKVYVNLQKLYNITGEESLPKVFNSIYSYEGKVNDEIYKEFLSNGKILESYYEMYNGNLEKAEELLKESETILRSDKMHILVDTDISLKLAFGDLEAKKGNYIIAEDLYKEIESEIEERNSKEYELPILNSFTSLYYKSNNVEKFSSRVKELSTYLMGLRNNIANTYFQASIDDYYSVKKMKEENSLKVRNTFIFSSVISLLLVFLIFILRKVRRLNYENRHDGLTSAFNRRQFDRVYNLLMEKDKEFSLIIFDVDNFKELNDNFGHEFGDLVLKRITGSVMDFLGHSGAVYRYGGEEFVIVVNNKDLKNVVEISEGVRKSVDELSWGEGVKVTISLGVASSDGDNSKVLERADYNLYRSKNTGKNRVTY